MNLMQTGREMEFSCFMKGRILQLIKRGSLCSNLFESLITLIIFGGKNINNNGVIWSHPNPMVNLLVK